MDAQTCLKKLEYVGVLAFATVDKNGAPQIRNISAIHYEPDRMIFFTAKGKAFCEELLTDGRVQVLGNCPQRCIEPGNPHRIQQNHCLHCGNCFAVCPVKAVEKRD